MWLDKRGGKTMGFGKQIVNVTKAVVGREVLIARVSFIRSVKRK
jgi:hypothetical protein